MKREGQIVKGDGGIIDPLFLRRKSMFMSVCKCMYACEYVYVCAEVVFHVFVGMYRHM